MGSYLEGRDVNAQIAAGQAPVEPFDDDLLAPDVALSDAHDAVTAALHRLAMEPLGIDAALADLLVQLYRSPECGIRGVQIGEQCHMTATRVSRLVDRAQAEGLVERQPDPADRRAQHVVLTTKGRDVAHRYAPLLEDVLRRIYVDGFSRDERAALVELLRRVRDRARHLAAAGTPTATR